jgi:hypothetical protein
MSQTVINMTDIFVEGGQRSANKLDVIYLGSFFLIAVLMVFIFLIAPAVTSAGLIYSLLAFITFLLIAFATISHNKLFSVVIFGKDTTLKKILIDIILGASLILLMFILIPDVVSYLHFSLVPFSLTGTSNDSLITALIVIFAGVEIEEMFLNSTFIPTVGVFNKGTKSLTSAIVYHFGLVVLFFGAYIFGFTALIAGALLFIIGIILAPILIEKKHSRDKSPIIHIFGITLGVTFLSILHVYSYHIINISTAISALIPLMLFFSFEAIINWYRQSTITSRSMHSLANTLAIVASGLVTLGTGIIIYLIYMLFIIGLAYSHGDASKGTRLLRNRL